MSITNKELVDAAASAGGITKKAAQEIVAALFDKITESLKSGEQVVVRDFGRFYTKTRDARTARNPKTGAAVQVPARQVTKFVPRGSMK